MSIIKHVTLEKIVVRDFRYDPRITNLMSGTISIHNGPELLFTSKNNSGILHTSACHGMNKGFNSSIGPLRCDRLCCDQMTTLLTSKWNSILI